MLCPLCQHDNLEGDDYCANCGAELRNHDTPEQAPDYRGPLLGEHLDELGPQAPLTLDGATGVTEAIARMHGEGIDCVLVTEGGRLVGIFTDRDAVLKVAGRNVGGATLADLMTRDPVVLRHDDPIAVAIHKMAVGGFRHIPIVDGSNLPTGVVSARDVFRHIASQVR